MAVVSVRLNKDEERILSFLSEYFHEDKSTLFKKSMYELYEDIQDIKVIEENIENKKDQEFITAEDLLD
jgi:N-acetylglutamate synthase-like GNAT family acetyltransferase